MPELVYNVKFKIDTNIQEGAAGITAYKERTEELTAELEKANEQIAILGKGGAGGGDPFKKVNQGAVNAGKSFSIANQAVFSFSDGIQDATQFSQGFSSGMRAIGNNIGFTAELFSNLQRRVDEYNKDTGESITTTDAFRQAIFKVDEQGNILRNSFGLMQLSATGFVLAINAGITILSMITTAFERADKQTENAKNSLDDYIKSISRLRGLTVGELGIVESLREEERLLNRVRPILEQNEQLERQIALTRSEALQSPSIRKANEEQVKSLQDRIEANENIVRLLGVEVESIDELDSAIRNIGTALGLLQTDDFQTRLGADIDAAVSQSKVALSEFNANLDGSNDALNQQIEFLDSLISAYRNLANVTSGETRRAYVEATNTLKDQKEQLENAIPELAAPFEFDVEGFGNDMSSFISELGLDLSDELNESFNKRSETLQKESLDRRVADMNRFNAQMVELTKMRVDSELKLEQMKEQARVSVFNSAQNAISSLSQMFADKNKGLAIGLLAVEKGLKVAQVVTSAARSIAEVQASASVAFARASAAAGGLGPIALAAGAAAASPILAQIPLIKTTSALSIAAILAQGLSQGGQIMAGGGKSPSSASGGGGGFGFQMTDVQGPQTFRTPGFMPSGQDAQPKVFIANKVVADRKQLYVLNKLGEEEYRQIKV